MATTDKRLFEVADRSDAQLFAVKAFRSARRGRNCLVDLDSKLIGESQIMRALKDSIEMVAASEETVLITGESGTGKELIARALHDLSPRRKQPFLAINCGALTESLLESELFGHLKGAFTGANVSKKGIFESASGGSVFLDEIGEMSSATQVKLLRVLQERKVRPVGLTNTREIEIDARVLVATNHDLSATFQKENFVPTSITASTCWNCTRRHCAIVNKTYCLWPGTSFAGITRGIAAKSQSISAPRR